MKKGHSPKGVSKSDAANLKTDLAQLILYSVKKTTDSPASITQTKQRAIAVLSKMQGAPTDPGTVQAFHILVDPSRVPNLDNLAKMELVSRLICYLQAGDFDKILPEFNEYLEKARQRQHSGQTRPHKTQRKTSRVFDQGNYNTQVSFDRSVLANCNRPLQVRLEGL